MPTTSFERIWPIANEAAGWLTRDQAALLHSTAATLGRDATVVEIGSYEGRSTLMLASGLQHEGSRVVAIDPWTENWKFGAVGTRDRFIGAPSWGGAHGPGARGRRALSDRAPRVGGADRPVVHRRQA